MAVPGRQEDPESRQDADAAKVGMVWTWGAAVLRPYEVRLLIANR